MTTVSKSLKQQQAHHDECQQQKNFDEDSCFSWTQWAGLQAAKPWRTDSTAWPQVVRRSRISIAGTAEQRVVKYIEAASIVPSQGDQGIPTVGWADKGPSRDAFWYHSPVVR